MPTDITLIARLKNEQEQQRAFTQLYDRYWKRLFVVAANKLNNLSVAEELVQDIFSDLWTRRASLEITGELGAYLATALKYQVINYQAKQKRESAYKEFKARRLQQNDESTENYLAFEELKSKLAELVSQLPTRCQLTYRLSREQGRSQKEIAEALSISEKAVEHNLHRAKKTLRAGLQDFLTILPFFL